jgi:hypothetical protein
MTHSLKSILPFVALSFTFAISAWADNQVADSSREFSSTQGQEDWYYGYINGPAPSTFQKMENYGTSQNNAWCYSDKETDLDCWLDSDGGHSTTAGDGTALWATRRWVSTVKGNIKISGHLAKDNVKGGDGFFGRIYVDGREVYSKFISGTDTLGEDFSVLTKVSKKSKVDFVIDFNQNADKDDAKFTATIETTD